MRPPPTDAALPPGFAVRLSPLTRLRDGGRTLVGGTRGGVLYLREPAAGLLDAAGVVRADDPVGARLCRLLLDGGYADPCWAVPPGPDAEVDDVTVVVPVRDRPGPLAALLAALPTGVDPVVVDDGSRDPAAVAALAREHGARLLVHEVNRGPAAARNTGLAAVQTAFVAFCDSDVVPASGWLAGLRRHLQDPGVAAAAPRVRGVDNTVGGSWVERYEQARSSLDLGPVPAGVRPGAVVSYVPSACLLARVEALGTGFDERLRVAEDVDLVWRLVAAGWRVRYEPGLVVGHRNRVRLGAWLRRKASYGTGAAALAARHGSAAAPVRLSWWSAAFAAGVLAQRPGGGLLAAGALGTAGWRASRRLTRSRRPVATAAGLTVRGGGATLRQVGSALTRHHWPLAVGAGLVSRRARRALVVAAATDGLCDWCRDRPGLDPARYLLARRLDDAAYGAGLWWGAACRRSVAALLPAVGASRGLSGGPPREGSSPTGSSPSPGCPGRAPPSAR